jgi:2-polyprenyl-6-methoxyphenol hydroxylase-like FAD-dependent oxidoreductase
MELDDFAQTEVGVAVAVTAVATSPSIRKTLRKGAAYGLAGVLLAGDAAHRFVNAIAKGARHASGTQTKVIEVVAVDTTASGAVDA